MCTKEKPELTLWCRAVLDKLIATQEVILRMIRIVEKTHIHI
jgi:hypothetical protein